MDSIRFDRLSKRLAARRTRRQALTAGGAGLAAGLFVTARRTTAQDATPAASPVATPAYPADPHPSADHATTHPEYLFVQPFDSGTWTPKPGANGVYLLTLTGAAAHTTYFSDRPERDAGLAPTQPFLDGLGFTPKNPPNAAIVAQNEKGEEDVLVVELITPVYDAKAATLTYEAKVVRDYGGRGLAVLAQQQADYTLAASFGEGSLFIDDCPNSLLDECYSVENGDWSGTRNFMGYIQSGNCWNSKTWLCQPCGSYSSVCNSTYPACFDACKDDIELCGAVLCGGG